MSLSKQANEIMQWSADKRYQFLVEEVRKHQQVWILTDEHGCVMLSSEDEDCVPVWPSQECAEYWATSEWEKCSATAIELQNWLKNWTLGLEGDDISVAVFPNPDEEGLIVSPSEFDEDIRK